MWQLQRCLYGLKQSPRQWNLIIDTIIYELRFERFITEHGMYVVGSGDERIVLALYVDDLLIAWRSGESLAEVKERFKEHFKIKDLGSARFLLGVEIRRRLEGEFLMVQGSQVWDGGCQGGIDTFRAVEPAGADRGWGRGWVGVAPGDGGRAVSQLSG